MVEAILAALHLNDFDPYIEDENIIIQICFEGKTLKAYFKNDVNYYTIPKIYYVDKEIIRLSGLSYYADKAICLFLNDVIPNPNFQEGIYVAVAEKLRDIIIGKINPIHSTIDEIYTFWNSKKSYGIFLEDYFNSQDFVDIHNNILVKSDKNSMCKYISLGELNDISFYSGSNNERICKIVEDVCGIPINEVIKGKTHLAFTFQYNENNIFIGFECGEINFDAYINKRESDFVINYKPDKFIRLQYYEVSQESVQNRASDGYESDKNSNITVIGAGALGSNLCRVLLEYGFLNLTIIDKEKLQPENVLRHFCDFSDINIQKAEATSKKLQKKYPFSNIEYYNNDVLYLNKLSEIFKKSDLIIITVGQRNIEKFICDNLYNSFPEKKAIITFVEPYMISGHGIFCEKVNPFETSMFDQNLDFTESVLDNSIDYQKKDFGCSGKYVQYGNFDMNSYLYKLVVDVDDFINSKFESCHVSYIGNLEKAHTKRLKLNYKYYDPKLSGTIKRIII
ncbi:MAG: ThiF family adenylyltransferase [Tenericutes bacterium]|nr:ThiF family adenylyltransferase [Mycoplasmatota bacterium]